MGIARETEIENRNRKLKSVRARVDDRWFRLVGLGGSGSAIKTEIRESKS